MTAYTEFDAIPRGHFGAICADPPWHHASRSPKGQNRRSPSHHYATMSLAEICALPVQDIAARHCHLMLWTTQPHLQQAFTVMEAWGFRYSSVFLFWLKLNPRAADEMFVREENFFRGLGRTTRKNVELCLLGRRGSPKRLVRNMPDFLIAARRTHSRKPDQSFDRITTYAPGPHIELFSRENRPGWSTYGLEVGKFDELPAAAPISLPEPPPLGPPPVAPIFDEVA